MFDRPRFKAQSESGLFLSRPNNLAHGRLVIIVGKKNVKRAVDRNRLKRVLKEIIRDDRLLEDHVACDVVFVARKGVLKTLEISGENSDLKRLCRKLIRKMQTAA